MVVDLQHVYKYICSFPYCAFDLCRPQSRQQPANQVARRTVQFGAAVASRHFAQLVPHAAVGRVQNAAAAPTIGHQ